MKAILLSELGGREKLKLSEVPIPEISPNEVLISVKASALNRRDIFIRTGNYPGIQLPAIPGADGAGEVVRIGDNVKKVEVGEEVIINPALNWGDNERIYSKNFSIFGVPTNGTFAEYIKVPAENIVKKPTYLSWEEAAAVPLGGLTAYRALCTRGKLRKGETVVIPGIGGGVATFVLQIAVALGANVYVTSSSQEKIQKAIDLGAVGGVNYKDKEWEKQLRLMMKGQADLLVDSIGGITFSSLVDLAKHGSRIVTFGATTGPVLNQNMAKIFLKQIDILGTTMGSPKEFTEMVQFFEEHKMKPSIDSVYELHQIIEAQKKMEEGHSFGKIVFTMNSKGGKLES